jgi:hypothetical protein
VASPTIVLTDRLWIGPYSTFIAMFDPVSIQSLGRGQCQKPMMVFAGKNGGQCPPYILNLVIQFVPVTIGERDFGIGMEEVIRVGGPRHVSHEI